MSDSRTEEFKRNRNLENILRELNRDLWPSEKNLLSRKESSFPLVFVMGPLRSGTTLFMQWLANTGLFAYPTNLLSRFYNAPIIGAKIQLLLTDPLYNFRDELGEFIQQSEYKSENGKTKGVLAPNEFWYFWRRFLPDAKRDVWADDELKNNMDTPTMLAELAGIMDVFQKPLAVKGMLFNYNIPFLDSVLDNVLFVQIKRDPVANVASVLEARKRQLGSEDAWYSFKIPEYQQLKDLPPIQQAAGQVHFINQAVSKGLENVDDSRKLVVQYEDFCEDPSPLFDQLKTKLNLPSTSYSGPEKFKSTRTDSVPKNEEIEKALGRFQTSPPK